MGLLDAVLGNVLGGGQQRPQQGGGAGALVQIVAGMLAQQGGGGGAGGLGGLAGLAEQFQRGGLGDVMSSWIGKGQNLPISADQLGNVLGGNVLGGDVLGKLTQHTGLDQGDLLGQLSQLLPQMVDHATPDGQMPAGGGIGDIGSILAKFGSPAR